MPVARSSTLSGKRVRIRASRDEIEHLLTHKVADVIVRDTLRKKLESGKRLRVKLGVDPTAPDLHLGHAVLLWKLREFHDLGHAVVFIIGDATGRIGDPSGKSKVRPRLAAKEVARNAQTYLKQVGRILDMQGHVEVRFNSEWFSKKSFTDLLDLATNFTVARLAEREDFRARLCSQKDLYLHEFFYPVMQAYDSIAVRADVEIGGTDQLFNMLAGRDLQRKLQKPEQDVVTTPLLVGTDGVEKMSKSLGNTVGITEPPGAMFGKLMAIPDGAIRDYAHLATPWDIEKMDDFSRRLGSKENPRDIKADVAEEIVTLYHGAPRAQRAREEFSRVFQGKQLPAEMPSIALTVGSWDPVALLLSLKVVHSRSAARRLFEQGGVRIDGVPHTSWATPVVIRDGTVVQVGKRTFVRVTGTNAS